MVLWRPNKTNAFKVISERTAVKPPENLKARQMFEATWAKMPTGNVLNQHQRTRSCTFSEASIKWWLHFLSLCCNCGSLYFLPLCVRLWHSFVHSGCLRLASRKLCSIRTNLSLSSPSLPRKTGPRFVFSPVLGHAHASLPPSLHRFGVVLLSLSGVLVSSPCVFQSEILARTLHLLPATFGRVTEDNECFPSLCFCHIRIAL